MVSLSQDYINVVLSDVQTLHARFANELCDTLKRHRGDLNTYNELVSINNVIGRVINILYDYIPVGNTVVNDLNNNLSETEIMSLINYSYKVLNKYNSNIFLPSNPNIYL